jgi:hypothetical protein
VERAGRSGCSSGALAHLNPSFGWRLSLHECRKPAQTRPAAAGRAFRASARGNDSRSRLS